MNHADMGFNKFCGPAALSILTGRNTDECAFAISGVNGKYKITGVTVNDLILAGNRLGCDFNNLESLQGRSLFFTATMIPHIKKEGYFLVLVPKHYVVLHYQDGRLQLCDNHTKEPIDLQNSARLHMKVEAIYHVTVREMPKPKPKPIVVESTYHAGYIHSSSCLVIRRQDKYNDDSTKSVTLASVDIPKDQLQEIAFKIMELTHASTPSGNAGSE